LDSLGSAIGAVEGEPPASSARTSAISAGLAAGR
jgi:hypothetical protein